jgi:hypothetical protein
MKLTHLAFAALCASCATATDPTSPPPEPEEPRAAPAEPMPVDSAGALQQRLLSDANFAGLYMHPPGSATAIVLFTGADPAAQLARYTRDRRFTARAARYSYARMRATQDTLGAAFARERIHFMSSSTDVIGNRVEFTVVNEAETRAQAATHGIAIPEEVVFISQGGFIATPQTLPPEITTFPQARYPAGAEMMALMRGRLTIENGCIRVGEGPDSSLVIWPSSAKLERDAQRIVIRDQRSGNVVAVGDIIEMGGGQSSELDEGFLTGGVPTSCRGPYWIAATGWRASR